MLSVIPGLGHVYKGYKMLGLLFFFGAIGALAALLFADAAAAKAVKGVVDVVQIPQGVAVLAKDTWSAMKGREALKVAWDDER